MSSTNNQNLDELKALLAQAAVIRGACELDLLVFLYRHPRTLLTNEQLATYVGYDMKQVAKAVDAFIDAQILDRTTQTSTHAARMYLLVLDGPRRQGLHAVLGIASTRRGRQNILRLLLPSQSPAPMDIQPKRRLYAIS